MTFDEAKAWLVARGVRSDLAHFHASAVIEYREADRNIQDKGSVVANPRTGAPMDNPYLKVRDAAAKRLAQNGRLIKVAAELWDLIFPPAASPAAGSVPKMRPKR